MSYSDPPEWEGRGARSRDGWPGGSAHRDPPRSHRADGDPTPNPRSRFVGEDRVRIERADTGEFRPSREPYPYDEMPTDPIIRTPPPAPQVPPGRRDLLQPAGAEPGVRHIVLPVDRAKDPVERFLLWLRVAVHVLGIVALLAAIWCLGMVIAVRGVPLWVPRS